MDELNCDDLIVDFERGIREQRKRRLETESDEDDELNSDVGSHTMANKCENCFSMFPLIRFDCGRVCG